MPLPAGFVDERVLKTTQTGAEPTLPSGFVEEGKATPELRLSPPKRIMDKMIGFFKDNEKLRASAQNIYALSEVTGLPLNEVNKNYEILRRSSQIVGFNTEPSNREITQAILLPGVIAGAMINPIGTAAGLIAFGVL